MEAVCDAIALTVCLTVRPRRPPARPPVAARAPPLAAARRAAHRRTRAVRLEARTGVVVRAAAARGGMAAPLRLRGAQSDSVR